MHVPSNIATLEPMGNWVWLYFPKISWGAFPSTKTFENLEAAVLGTEICRKSFQIFRKPKIFEIPGAKLNGKKTSWKNFSKIWAYLGRLSYFGVSFATGSSRRSAGVFFRRERSYDRKYVCASQTIQEIDENSNRKFWLNGKHSYSKLLSGTGKNWPMANRHVSRNNPRNTCATHLGSSSQLAF